MQKKLLNNQKIKIFNDNCLNTFKQLKNDKILINHIITDPPYAISSENNFHTMNNPRKGVDFGEWDWDFNPCLWLDDAYPLLDKNGSMVIFCSYRFISQIIHKIEHLGGVVKDVMIWQKQNPMPRNINRRYVQDMEFIIWALKNKNSKWVFNKPANKPYQRGFFQTPTLLGKERTKHPTQKPLALMSEIIQIHTNENEIILDPFMGVGSTGVACQGLNRYFIGIEQDKAWFDIAGQRLNL